MTQVQIVQDLYAAFSRADIPQILSLLSPDVEWIDPGEPGIPYAGTYRGTEAVANFFKKMAETTDTLRFEPREYFAEGDRVVALGYYQARSKATGRTAGSDWAMSWVIRDRKVSRFQAFIDTAALAE